VFNITQGTCQLSPRGGNVNLFQPSVDSSVFQTVVEDKPTLLVKVTVAVGALCSSSLRGAPSPSHCLRHDPLVKVELCQVSLALFFAHGARKHCPAQWAMAHSVLLALFQQRGGLGRNLKPGGSRICSLLFGWLTAPPALVTSWVRQLRARVSSALAASDTLLASLWQLLTL